MSLFSIGDLITLVVVLLILVIFRALDRNNRSLEKLKRFSDKIAENLSTFVEEKTVSVRELSVELQASLKTGKDMIARARGVEEMLQGRAGISPPSSSVSASTMGRSRSSPPCPRAWTRIS